MQHWKTTLIGAIVAVLQAYQSGAIATGDPVLIALSAVTIVLGYLAQDPNVKGFIEGLNISGKIKKFNKTQ